MDSDLVVDEYPNDEIDRGPGFPNTPIKKAMIFVIKAGKGPSSLYSLKMLSKRGWATSKVELTNEPPVALEHGGLKGEIKSYGDFLVTVLRTSKDLECTDDLSHEIRTLCVDGVIPMNTLLQGCYYYEEIEE